jgi:hypothetical protein
VWPVRAHGHHLCLVGTGTRLANDFPLDWEGKVRHRQLRHCSILLIANELDVI